jgi:hypothetical protein
MGQVLRGGKHSPRFQLAAELVDDGVSPLPRPEAGRVARAGLA